MRMKMTALLLALLLALPLTACSGKETAQNESQTPEESTTIPVETEAGTQPDDSPAPEETLSAEETVDPEDPENVAVGDREENLTMVVEGIEETVPAVRHSSWMGYAMTYDPAMFTLIEREDGDLYLGEQVEGRPNVYISISMVDGLTDEEAVEGLRLQNGIEAESVTVALGQHDYAATYLRWAEGAGSNDATVEFYVSEQNGTLFLIEVGNFVDGQEGFGARMNAMLATLTF